MSRKVYHLIRSVAAGADLFRFRHINDMFLTVKIVRNRLAAMAFLRFPSLVSDLLFRLCKAGDLCPGSLKQTFKIHLLFRNCWNEPFPLLTEDHSLELGEFLLEVLIFVVKFCKQAIGFVEIAG